MFLTSVIWRESVVNRLFKASNFLSQDCAFHLSCTLGDENKSVKGALGEGTSPSNNWRGTDVLGC